MPGSCYHDFKHCVWLTLGDAGAEHPWNQHMEHVPAHVTVRAYLDSAGDAREVARAAARRCRARWPCACWACPPRPPRRISH